MLLTALTFATTHTTHVQKFNDFTADTAGCTASPVVTTPTVPGDYTGRVQYALGTLNAGQSKTVEFLYRRF